MSKVRFIQGRAQQLSLKRDECMKEFSVDIILMLPGNQFLSWFRKILPLHGGRWIQRTKVDKSFQLWVWMPENFSRSTSCTKYNLPLRASKLSPLFSTICFFCGQHILCKIQREIEWTVLKPIGGRWDTYIPQITTASLQLHTFLRVCSLAVGSAAYKIMYMISCTSTLQFYLLYFLICVCVWFLENVY